MTAPLLELQGISRRFVQRLDFAAKVARLLGADVREYSVQAVDRSEEHMSELQSCRDLVCRLLLEKKKPSLSLICALFSPIFSFSSLPSGSSPSSICCRISCTHFGQSESVLRGHPRGGFVFLSAFR